MKSHRFWQCLNEHSTFAHIKQFVIHHNLHKGNILLSGCGKFTNGNIHRGKAESDNPMSHGCFESNKSLLPSRSQRYCFIRDTVRIIPMYLMER